MYKVKYLTLYTFSTENWKRPKKEIVFLIELLEKYIDQEISKILEKNIRLKIIGNIKKFPNSLKYKLQNAEKLTKKNNKIQINIALNYGSKRKLLTHLKKLKNYPLELMKKI